MDPEDRIRAEDEIRNAYLEAVAEEIISQMYDNNPSTHPERVRIHDFVKASEEKVMEQ